jgi:hypothetical protein
VEEVQTLRGYLYCVVDWSSLQLLRGAYKAPSLEEASSDTVGADYRK